MFIVVRKASDDKERDQVYSCMFEGRPQTTYTLGKKAARLDKPMAEKVAAQLNGLFPGWKWVVMTEGEFHYDALPASQRSARDEAAR